MTQNVVKLIAGKILFAHAFKISMNLQDLSWYNIYDIDNSFWKITDSGKKSTI